MQPGNIEPGRVRSNVFGFDFVKRHWRRVNASSARRAMNEQLRRHDRTRVEANRTARQEITAAQSNEVGRTGTSANEVNGHYLIQRH